MRFDSTDCTLQIRTLNHRFRVRILLLSKSLFYQEAQGYGSFLFLFALAVLHKAPVSFC